MISRGLVLLGMAVLVALPFAVFASEPFRLPVSAEPDASAPALGGWTSSGTMRVSVDLARRQLAIGMTAAGWTHRHTIPVGRGRVVESWVRGEDELTLMTWRIAAGRSGYSFGVVRRRQNERRSAREEGD